MNNFAILSEWSLENIHKITFIKKLKGILTTKYEQIAKLEHLFCPKRSCTNTLVSLSKVRVGREARSPVQFPFPYILDHDSSAENDISFFVRLLISTNFEGFSHFASLEKLIHVIAKKSCLI